MINLFNEPPDIPLRPAQIPKVLVTSQPVQLIVHSNIECPRDCPPCLARAHLLLDEDLLHLFASICQLLLYFRIAPIKMLKPQPQPVGIRLHLFRDFEILMKTARTAPRYVLIDRLTHVGPA